MIKAFLFDYDGVITQGVDVTLPAKRLAQNTGISDDDATDMIMSIWDRYSTGKISTDEVWDIIETRIGKQVSEDHRHIWHTWEELQPISYMIEFVKELQSAGYPVGLLSNVFEYNADIIRKNGGYDVFDFTVLSHEVGARKPESKVYELAMQKLKGIGVSEVLFLDDRLHCINGAKEFGLNTILVVDHQQAIKEVRQIIKSK